MRSILITAFAAQFALGLAGPGTAESFTGPNYTALSLLSPCQEADNDSRWGAAAETECEQYIMGFVDAMMQLGAIGPEAGACPPAQNTADEVRWAYMRWVHADYSGRKDIPAADALLMAVKDSFPCN